MFDPSPNTIVAEPFSIVKFPCIVVVVSALVDPKTRAITPPASLSPAIISPAKVNAFAPTTLIVAVSSSLLLKAVTALAPKVMPPVAGVIVTVSLFASLLV